MNARSLTLAAAIGLCLGLGASACLPAKAACSASTCGGCCGADGQCQFGNGLDACGNAGQLCSSCQLGQVCTLGICSNVNQGGGPGGGSGGGTAGGAGGGTAGGAGGGTAGGAGGGTAGGAGGGTAGGAGGGTAGGAGGGTAGGAGGGTAGGAGGGTGGGTALPGETCATAEALAFSGDTATAQGTTAGYAADSSSPVCGGTGSDRVYRFTLTAPALVEVTVTPLTGGYTPIAYLAPDATPCSASPSLGCDEAPLPGDPAAFTSTSTLTAGSYLVYVDGLAGASGAYVLSVRRQTGGGAGDSCTSGATPLTFAGNTATASGSTASGYLNDLTATASSCFVDGPDRVYSFALAASASVTVSLQASGGWAPAFHLTPAAAMCNANQLACAEGSTFAPATGTYALSAGTYYLWVDGQASTDSGSYALTVTQAAGNPPGDTCTAPGTLSFVGGSATASGATTGASNVLTSATCGGSGPDVVYTFVVTGTQTFAATATGAGGLRPVLTLHGPSAGCSSTNERTCNAATATNGTASIPSTTLTAGTYSLWIDSWGGPTGTFTLNATLSGGPPSGSGESCAGPAALTFAGGAASVTGTTVGRVGDGNGTCGGSGPDLVYSFTVTGTQTFAATLTSTGGATTGLWPVLYLRGPSATCTSANEVTCNAGGARGTTASIPSRTLTSGTYYLWVDTWSGTTNAGTFTLNATLN